MRVAVLLALLLAGCVLPPPSPVTPEDVSGAREFSAGVVTVEVQPSVLSAPFGERAGFTVRVVRGDVERLSTETAWASLNGSMQMTRARPGQAIEGWIVAGVAPRLVLHVDDTRVEGPPVRTEADATVPASERRDVVGVDEVPPGLSYANGTVIFAAERVRRSTIDEDVGRVIDWAYTDGVLVGLVRSYRNDAVAPLPEPERPRVVADVSWLPRGPLEVRAHVLESCYCVPQPPRTQYLNVTLE